MTGSSDEPHDDLLIVTTRSRLRSARFFPPMLLATLLIRRQLARADGLVRSASLIASPTEFWTITAWRSRHAMQEFTRSDEHGQIMWRFSRWLHSIWLMRWRPGPCELGSWSGLTLAPVDATASPPVVDPVASEVLESLPVLKSAVGADGAARYATSPEARRERRKVAGVAGVVVGIHAPYRRFPGALRELVRLRRSLGSDPRLLRSVVGIGRPGHVYFLAVFAEHEEAVRFLRGDWTRSSAQRWGDGFWATAWLPENEFGHWDGMRVRRERRRRAA
ncbi:MAG: hypothetical protein GEU83_15965 [Pseudonocardiaceae bacterium]|nr:hypothetical protein [Pseudonocardiaceae bacterium]